jgi:hypothetical protein
MRVLASVKVRLFLCAWVLFATHLATNVVREHYPAFSLIERGDFILDAYAGFHSDIFQHANGHYYIGNQVTGSMPAVVPLLLFDPLLDALEQYSKRKLEDRGDEVQAAYDTEYPGRQRFFQLVKERGLELRFGAATVVTSVFLMAPLSAGFVAFMYAIFRRRGVRRRRGIALALLFGFGTPIFYRTAHLNHNMFFMMVVFGSFWLLWPKPEESLPLRPYRIYMAGFLAGLGVALDYAGVIPLLALYGYLLVVRARAAGLMQAFVESLRFVAGSVAPVLFLLWSQWAMYGNPFLPGQYHMPEVNFTERGWRGMDWPKPCVFLRNLFDPSWGMYPFAPLLLLGLVPVQRQSEHELILPKRERRFGALFVLAFMLFCAGNQYSLMQWNTGFRYLLPVIPFIFLALSDHLVRLSPRAFAAVSIPAVVHVWVLSMVRYVQNGPVGETTVPECWRRVLDEGLQLPWLSVLRQTTPDPQSLVHWWMWPYLLLAVVGGVCVAIWQLGARAERGLTASSGDAVPVDR